MWDPSYQHVPLVDFSRDAVLLVISSDNTDGDSPSSSSSSSVGAFILHDKQAAMRRPSGAAGGANNVKRRPSSAAGAAGAAGRRTSILDAGMYSSVAAEEAVVEALGQRGRKGRPAGPSSSGIKSFARKKLGMLVSAAPPPPPPPPRQKAATRKQKVRPSDGAPDGSDPAALQRYIDEQVQAGVKKQMQSQQKVLQAAPVATSSTATLARQQSDAGSMWVYMWVIQVRCKYSTDHIPYTHG
jgi:hypothetical protein